MTLASDAALLDRLWSVRYSAPDELAAGLARVGDSPRRRVVDAFLMWRAQRLDEVLALTDPLLTSEQLDDVWLSRARGVQATVLMELGLVEEAVELHLEDLDAATLAGDLLSVARVTQNLGVTYQFVDPDLARDHFLDAMTLARSLQDGSDGVEAHALEALAIINVHGLAADYGTKLPTDIPTLADAERLARVGWPELAAAARAFRTLACLDAGDLARAQELAAGLPDQTAMRDVAHAANVVRVQARLAALQGRLDEAQALLEGMLDTVQIHVAADMLAELSVVLEQQGDLRGALDAARRRSDHIVRYHSAEAQVAVRALEVFHRTQEAEADARTATDDVDRLRQSLAEVNRDKERLRELSTRDLLTGLSNRLHLAEAADQLRGGVHELALIDVDRFKGINDTHGHAVGDDALRRVGAAVRAATGPDDLCARYGGDEFVVLRPAGSAGALATDLEGLTRLAGERGEPVVTTSIGVAWMSDGDLTGALRRADELMYRAKRSGGAAVVVGCASSAVEHSLPALH